MEEVFRLVLPGVVLVLGSMMAFLALVLLLYGVLKGFFFIYDVVQIERKNALTKVKEKIRS